MTSLAYKSQFYTEKRYNGKDKENKSEIKELKRKLEEERAKCEDYELDNKNKDAYIVQLKNEIEIFKLRLRSLNDTLSNMVTFEEYDRLKSQFDSLSIRYENCHNELNFYSNCTKELREELKTSYCRNQELNNKLNSMFKDMEKLAIECAEYNNLKMESEEMAERIKGLSEENDDLRLEVEAFKGANRSELFDESSQLPNIDSVIGQSRCESMSLFTEMMLSECESKNQSSPLPASHRPHKKVSKSKDRTSTISKFSRQSSSNNRENYFLTLSLVIVASFVALIFIILTPFIASLQFNLLDSVSYNTLLESKCV